MSRPVFILLIPLVLIFLHHCNAFTWKCPDNLQWFLRSNYKCKDKAYLCLFDIEHSTYKEICRKGEEIGREGFKYILTPNPDQVPCNASRYQPFTFTTNGNSQCTLRKSLCKSSGQIVASNGSFFADASCRCDYTRNFDYIIPPKDPCSCKPAEEDCSCHIRKCENDRVMIADYRCMKRVETILPEEIKCPIISRIIPPKETDPVDMKQFKQVSSSRTWSKQASAILIVIVIVFTVLIGFLFLSVPNVTSILLKSKLELYMKRKENEFIILNGDRVKIECNFKSYIPVRSVTWQKEIDGEIIQITQYKDKYEMFFGEKPSLTINNFNAEDQGKYRCIIRNAIGLRNEMFVSCMLYMSSVNWLTRIVKVLQHIPAFYTKDMMYMTLHTYGKWLTLLFYSSKYKQNVKRHTQNAHAPNNAETKHFTMYLCDQCGMVFKTASGLNIHYKGKHTQEFRFKCKVCDRGFNTLWNYRGHITTHEPVLRHRCDVCDKTFAYKETLKQHITSVHTNETSIIICSKEGCGASCNSQKSLKEHFLAVHGGRELKCDLCGKSYKWRSSLRYHKEHVHC
ncbi:unnamed protein product [Mytilus edulis]|uniref:Uncharacterized protein n=1 Tax=Mytilus edulis TaxID=6550 RepID=A0A8S3RAK3_MYTED|nr:unnamed protein product [Mytilus edulis]